MSDSVLHKYARPKDEREADALSIVSRADSLAENAADDHGAFGWLRGVRERAVCLELRKKTGNIVAINYGWIERFEFDPSEGITLHAQGQQYRIKGRNLNGGSDGGIGLFRGLVRHRVPWVQETDRPASIEAGDGATVIESIE